MDKNIKLLAENIIDDLGDIINKANEGRDTIDTVWPDDELTNCLADRLGSAKERIRQWLLWEIGQRFGSQEMADPAYSAEWLADVAIKAVLDPNLPKWAGDPPIEDYPTEINLTDDPCFRTPDALCEAINTYFYDKYGEVPASFGYEIKIEGINWE